MDFFIIKNYFSSYSSFWKYLFILFPAVFLFLIIRPTESIAQSKTSGARIENVKKSKKKSKEKSRTVDSKLKDREASQPANSYYGGRKKNGGKTDKPEKQKNATSGYKGKDHPLKGAAPHGEETYKGTQKPSGKASAPPGNDYKGDVKRKTKSSSKELPEYKGDQKPSKGFPSYGESEYKGNVKAPTDPNKAGTQHRGDIKRKKTKPAETHNYQGDLKPAKGFPSYGEDQYKGDFKIPSEPSKDGQSYRGDMKPRKGYPTYNAEKYKGNQRQPADFTKEGQYYRGDIKPKKVKREGSDYRGDINITRGYVSDAPHIYKGNIKVKNVDKGKDRAEFAGDFKVKSPMSKTNYFKKISKKVHLYEGDIVIRKPEKQMHPSSEYLDKKYRGSREKVEKQRQRSLRSNRRNKDADQPGYLKEKSKKVKPDSRESDIWIQDRVKKKAGLKGLFKRN